jgi:hypothetical protein
MSECNVSPTILDEQNQKPEQNRHYIREDVLTIPSQQEEDGGKRPNRIDHHIDEPHIEVSPMRLWRDTVCDIQQKRMHDRCLNSRDAPRESYTVDSLTYVHAEKDQTNDQEHKSK